MKTKYLACETLKDEIQYILRSDTENREIIWLESGLHNFPKRLHQRLQESIEQVKDCDRLVLLFGRCGNSVDQIKNGPFELIVPRVDDCISLLFGSDRARSDYASMNAAYYLTEGWMRGERNLWVEYQHAVEKYGEEEAREIADMMYGHYRQLALLDTGIGAIEELMKKTGIIEETLGLKRCVVPATLDYLTELIRGPWNAERYYIVKPYETLHV